MDPSQPSFFGLPLLAWIPLLPLIGAFLNLAFARLFGFSRTWVHVIAVASVVASCCLAFFLIFLAPSGSLWAAYKNGQGGVGIEQTIYTWIEVGSFKAQLAFRLDTLSAVMVLIVTFVGSLIHIYSTGYMAHDKDYARFFGYLNLFTGSMLILVLGANMPVMFIGWEGVGLCSFLLIGFWYDNEAFATAGRKAFVVNRIGDFCFLLGMFLLFWATKDVFRADTAEGLRGSLDFLNLKAPAMQAVYAQPFWGGERLAAAAGILLFIGACGKSAQFPLYVWLPDAMAGPTPVSALIHAATMVTAGVYMVVRLSPLYSASTTALFVVSTVGLITALLAAFYAFAQTDLKKVLAYSTVSQLGFMFVAAGTGAWVAAIFHLATHAFFKAGLFLGAGSVMHGMEHGGSTTPGDITTMGGLRKHMPTTRWCFLIYCLAISGILPFAGFFSKDEILFGAWTHHPPAWPAFYGYVLWGGLLVAALGTAFYMWRLYFLVFSGEERSEAAKHAHESPGTMTGPLIVLAIFSTIIGLIGLPHLGWLAEQHSLEDVEKVGHSFASWLAPSVASNWHEGMAIDAHIGDIPTLILMGIALAIGATGIFVAWLFYGRGPSKSVDKVVEKIEPIYEASKNKLWVDEIYDAVFVRPFRLVARGLFEIVDRFIIDTVAVNGSAFIVGIFSRIARWFQNGQVQRYLVGVVVGAAAVFLVTDCHRKSTFSYKLEGDRIVLHADPGAGIASATAKLKWDLDGDGQPDIDPKTGKPIDAPDLSVPAGDVGAKVTLWIDDPISQKTEKVTRIIRIGDAQEGD
jgi:NADH-quinone oxidoreductase subunit L